MRPGAGAARLGCAGRGAPSSGRREHASRLRAPQPAAGRRRAHAGRAVMACAAIQIGLCPAAGVYARRAAARAACALCVTCDGVCDRSREGEGDYRSSSANGRGTHDRSQSSPRYVCLFSHPAIGGKWRRGRALATPVTPRAHYARRSRVRRSPPRGAGAPPPDPRGTARHTPRRAAGGARARAGSARGAAAHLSSSGRRGSKRRLFQRRRLRVRAAGRLNQVRSQAPGIQMHLCQQVRWWRLSAGASAHAWRGLAATAAPSLTGA